MAVTITNKFYETSTPGWHDLAKIVFTSPNLNSPANAGTRSHILPGQALLGLWYEDTSKMYRILEDQAEVPSDDSQISYMDIIDLYPGETYNFATESSVLVTIESVTGMTINTGDTLYNDFNNYGVIGSITTLTSGTPSYEDRTISVYNGAVDDLFFDDRRKGYSYKIYWTTTGIYTDEFISVYYSTNGGINWSILASGIENSGIADFIIPVESTATQLKIVSTLTPDIEDSSITFRVDSGTFDILTPATSALWRNRNTHRLWWNCERFFANELVGVSISFNTGSSWTSLVTDLPNTGYASVDIPATLSSQCILKVYSMVDPTTAYDISGVFSTYAGNTDILVPASGTALRNRNSAKIWWNSGAFYNDENVNVLVSYDSGDTWTTLASGVTNTGFAVVDLLETTSVYTKVKVESFVDPSYAYDISDTFQTIPGSFVLLTPSEGVSWLNRHDHKVWWNSLSFYSTEYVDVDISYDDSYSWLSLASGILNTGNCTVTLPIEYSSLYSVIRVKSNQDPLQAYTTTTFTVVIGSTINIKYPQNNSVLGNGTDHTIWWNSTNFYSSINMLKIASSNLISGPTVSGALLNKEYDISGVLLVPFLEKTFYSSTLSNFIYNSVASVSNFFLEVEFEEPKLINRLIIDTLASGVPNSIGDPYSTEVKLSVYGTNISFNGGYYTTILLNKTLGEDGWSDTTLSNTSYFYKYRVSIGLYTRFVALSNLVAPFYTYGHINTITLMGEDIGENSRDKVDILITDSTNNTIYTLASGVANMGFKTVTIPYNFSTVSGSKLLIRDTNNPEYLQDNIITSITSGTLSLLYPTASGITVLKGEPLYLWWNSDHIYDDGFVSLGLSTDSGDNYSLFGEQILNEGTYSWLLPMDTTAGNTSILAVFKNDGTEGVSGYSESTFTIEEPYISIVAPTSGTVVRLYSGDEYWFTTCSGVPTLGYEPINYKLYWETNIRNNKNVQVSLSVDDGITWSLLEDTPNAGVYSILEDIVMLNSVYENCRLKVTYNNTVGTILSSISEPFIIEKPWQKITNNLYSMDSWETNFFYKDYFYKLEANDTTIYRMPVSGTIYDSFVSFTEGIIGAPSMILKKDNVYILNTENRTFYEYLATEDNWRTLTPTPVLCTSLDSFSDNDGYLYAVSELGSVYRFDIDVYGGWFLIYSNKANNYYSKAGMAYIEGDSHDYLLIRDGNNLVDINNQGVAISGSLVSGTVYNHDFCNNFYDLTSVPLTYNTGYLFSVGGHYDLNNIYTYTISGSNMLLTPSGCLHCFEPFKEFNYNEFMTVGPGYFCSGTLNFDIETVGEKVFSFINNSNYISEWPITSGTAFFNQDYTYFSKKESTNNAVSSSFILDEKIAIASGKDGKMPFFQIDLASGTIGFPTGATYFSGYCPLDNSYVGNKFDVMCTDNAYVYKFDGYQEQGFYKIDIASGTLSYLSPPPVLISEFPQVVYNSVSNSIYMIHDDTDVNNLWKYSITSGTWTNTEDSLYVINKSMLSSSGKYVYVLEGGIDRTNFMRYDTIEDSWESLLNREYYPSFYTSYEKYSFTLIGSCSNYNHIYGVGKYEIAGSAPEIPPPTLSNIVGVIGGMECYVSSTSQQIYSPCLSTASNPLRYTLTFDRGTKFPPSPAPIPNISFQYRVMAATVLNPGTLTQISVGTGSGSSFIYSGSVFVSQYDVSSYSYFDSGTAGCTITFLPTGLVYSGASASYTGSNGSVSFSILNTVLLTAAFPTSTYSRVEIRFTYITGSMVPLKDSIDMRINWTTPGGVDDGACTVTGTGPTSSYAIGKYGLNLRLFNINGNTTFSRETVAGLTIDYTIPIPTPPEVELYLLEYDITYNSWRTLLKRMGISTSLGACEKARCACTDDFIYILWNEEADGEEIEIFKIKLNQIDYDSVAAPVGWIAPPSDLTQSTPPVGWAAPMEKGDSMPYTWAAPSNFDYLLESAPSGWEAPQTNILSSQPGTWVPPSAATLEPAPNGWVAPVASGSREPAGPVYGPSFSVIADGPPLIQVSYAKSINFSSVVGTKEISDVDNLYAWGITSISGAWLNVYNSIVFEITNGECYNCRLTAWDDITHQTTHNNILLASDRCRVHALAFSSTSSISPYTGLEVASVITKDILTPPAYVVGNRYLIGGVGAGAWVGKNYQIATSTTNAWTYTTLAVGDRVYVTSESCFYYRTEAGISKTQNSPLFKLDSFVKEPAHGLILKGDTSYYGDFNMKYRYSTSSFGDYLMFKPYLYNVDNTISYGVHDFYITLHFSYT